MICRVPSAIFFHKVFIRRLIHKIIYNSVLNHHYDVVIIDMDRVFYQAGTKVLYMIEWCIFDIVSSPIKAQ